MRLRSSCLFRVDDPWAALAASLLSVLFLFCQLEQNVTYTQLMFVLCLRSRQLELEDKQSSLELELRKYMEMSGVYC